MGCGYSEAYLGQNLEPFYQRDKAAGLIGPEEATFMLENLFIKLNEIGYYYGEKVAMQNSADLGQSISLGGFTEDGEDATAEMDYLILDASNYLHLPQPPLSCIYTEKMSGKFLEKVLDVIGTGIGMPQFVNGDVMMKRALESVRLAPRRASPSKKPGAPVSAPAWVPTFPTKPVTRWKGNPTWGRSSS